MKKILIPLDFHPTSEIIAKKGFELAEKLQGKIYLIHVLADLNYYNVSYPMFFGYDFNQISWNPRSEEHTSELQSRGHLVCRLLLEKKKKKDHKITNDIA